MTIGIFLFLCTFIIFLTIIGLSQIIQGRDKPIWLFFAIPLMLIVSEFMCELVKFALGIK